LVNTWFSRLISNFPSQRVRRFAETVSRCSSTSPEIGKYGLAISAFAQIRTDGVLQDVLASALIWCPTTTTTTTLKAPKCITSSAPCFRVHRAAAHRIPRFWVTNRLLFGFRILVLKQLKLTASGQAFSQRQREVGHPTRVHTFAYSFGVLASIL
jgi:hypothetical protein